MTSRSADLFLRRVRPLTASLRRGAYGVVSPDIVPVGAIPPPNAADLVLGQFDIDPAQRWTLNAPNQIYVRGVNASGDESGLDIAMFYGDGMLIPWPDTLLTRQLPTNQGVRQAGMPATRSGARFVSPLPFLLNTSSQAVSLLAAVTSRTTADLHPDGPVETAEALVEYYGSRPNVAVRNAVVVPVAPAERWSYAYDLSTRRMTGRGLLSASTWRIPVGWTVTLSYLADGAGQPEILLKATETTAPTQTFAADWNLKPDMEGTVLVAIDTNGVPPTRDWRIEVNVSLLLDVSHGLFGRGLAHEDVGHPLAPADTSASAVRAVTLGGFVIMAKESNAF